MTSTSITNNPDPARIPNCFGCHNPLDEGEVVAFGNSLFHLDCFICAKCGLKAEHTSKLLLLADGRPVCKGCSYICASCRQTIGNEAIMTDDEAYHAECFRCRACKKKIDDLVFTQTSKGIYCRPCHENRRADGQLQKKEKEKRSHTTTKTLPKATSQTGQDEMKQRHISRVLDPQLISDYIRIQEALERTEITQPTYEKSLPTPAPSPNVSNENLSTSSPASVSTAANSLPTAAKHVPPSTYNQNSKEEADLPEVSLNLSFFENDSSDMINLTKSLGSNLFNEGHHDGHRDQKTHREADKTTLPSKSKSAIDLLASLALLENLPLPTKGNIVSDTKPLPPLRPDLDSDGVSHDNAYIGKLKQELRVSNAKLAEVSEKFNMMKNASKRALDEFRRAKEDFKNESALRQQCEYTIRQLQQQMTLMRQAKFTNTTQLANTVQELEKTCKELEKYRNTIAKDIEEMVEKNQTKLTSTISHVHQQQQNALTAEIKSLKMERDALKSETKNLSRARDEVIDEMVILNTQIANLANMNNDLSRRVTEREREAAAMKTSPTYLHPTASQSTELSTPMQRKSSEASMIFGHVASRDSFNGTQSPTVFKIKKKNATFPKIGPKSSKTDPNLADDNRSAIYSLKSGSASTQSLKFFGKEVSGANASQGSHSFQVTFFLRPTKCETCREKMWGLSEYRCQGCGLSVHSKCLSHVPQICHASTASSLDLLGASHANENRSESMFGNELAAQANCEGLEVPWIVQKCIEAVEIRGMDVEGIYRRSGGATQIRMIQIAFENDEDIDLTDEEQVNDICSVTSVLKHYFRQLPSPLLTFELYPDFIEAVALSDESQKLDRFSELLSMLPDANYATLKTLMNHLYRVSQYSHVNRMSIKNLAMVFGPTLMQDQESCRDLLDMSYKNATIEYIIRHTDVLFSESY